MFQLLKQPPTARHYLGLTIGLGLLMSLTIVGQAYLLSHIINAVFLLGHTLSDVQPMLYLLLMLAVGRGGLTWGSDLSAQRLASLVKHDLRTRLSQHLLDLGPTYTQGERSGELSNTLTVGIESLDAYLSQYLPRLILAALTPLTILLFVLPLDILSGVVLLVTAPLIPVFMILIGGLAKERTNRQWTQLSRMSAYFLDVLQGLTTLKILGRSRDQIDIIARISRQFGDTTLDVLRIAFLSALVLELLASLSVAVIAVEIGLRLLYDLLPFQPALMILILAPEIYLPLRALGSSFHASMQGREAAQRIFEILATARQTSPSAKGVASYINAPIQFQLVSLTYAETTHAAVEDVNLTILPGQLTALVGPSGAGKSSLINLLLGFVQPQTGRITLGEQPLDQLDLATWRANIALVSQRPYLFHTTIAENIRLARADAPLSAVKQAAEQAHLHKFIETLPQAYDTPIGEQGSRLSGGQQQRLALARAFLKDAPLLILDEATANLDPDHEALIQDSLRRLMRGRTVLMIAHRLNTVQQADQILVMQQGRIVQQGTHAELLHQHGLYRQLVRG